ncbi:MAG: dockerin type I domain-containing protein, partial [Thermomicrobiales bacterium]
MPAFASSEEGGAARNANDGDYATFWRSVGTPAWLAYDLSSVPAAQRGQVVVAWYNDPMTPDYDPVLIGKNAYNLPTAYTLEANAAAGGAPPA